MGLESELTAIVGKDNLLTKEVLAAHTTFRVGGPCRYFITPRTADECGDVVRLLKKNSVTYMILGNGSNILVADKGYDGAVICTAKHMHRITVSGSRITADAGAMLPKVASEALTHSLSGLEFAAGIPGSIGGACIMNAGAYGGEMKDVICKATAICPDGEIRSFSPDDIQAGYRHTVFLTGDYVVLSVELLLREGDGEAIRGAMEGYIAARREKQPLEYPSAGSTFKRPSGDYAGRLIEASGLKGRGIGDACVSDKHAGFVINKGNATADDIYRTIMMVKDEVLRNSGIELECEVRMFGDFT